MAYRDAAPGEEAPRGDDGGIVGDVVRQFADPYAFYRELVQNAIDAGATRVRVRIDRGPDGDVHCAVQDDGKGMDSETIESKLLVLFRSGKESNPDAIGKFGIGFASVLALEPERVTVKTAPRTEPGRGYTLHLFADYRYELFEHGAERPGTTVTLRVPAQTDAAAREHAARSRNALRAWCEHATLPIDLFVDPALASETPAGTEAAAERISGPLALAGAAITHRATVGDTEIVVGLAGNTRGRFYNRGLLLFDTERAGRGADRGGWIPGLTFKVQDPHLEHTLSRDDVRRDGHFRRVMAAVLDTARGPLQRAMVQAMQERAADRKRYAALAEVSSPSPLDLRELPLRWLHPIEGRWWTRAERGLRVAPEPGTITEQLARRGLGVVDGAALGRLRVHLAASRLHLDDEWLERATAIRPIEPSPSDSLWLAQVSEAVAAVYREPIDMRLADVFGRDEGAVCVGDPGDDETPGAPFAWLRFRRAPLVLNHRHPLVRRCRTLAETNLDRAASLTTRGVLVSVGALDERRSEALAVTEIDALAGSARVDSSNEGAGGAP